jgi:glycosyltransferase involved in cell wall biosynthesis
VVGGAERSVELLAEEQSSLGHQVGVACIERQAEPATLRNDVTVYRMAHSNLFWLEDWPQHSQLARNYQKLKQQWNTAIERQFLDIIKEFKPDVINTHSMVDVSTLVWRAARKSGIPVVHTLRDYDLICGNAAMFRRGARCDKWHIGCRVVNISKLFTSKSVSGLAGVGTEIIQTHVDHGFFQHLDPSFRRPIWNAAVVRGSNAETRSAIKRSGPMTFGYLGRINVEKGVSTMIEAFRNIEASEYRVLVAGEAVAGLEEFSRAAEGLPIEFIGWAEPKTLFEAIDVLIVPSFWAEPLPRTILESYAMGVPVVGARSGGIPELIGYDNSDWLFEPGNSNDLTERLRWVISLGRENLPEADSFRHVLAETTPARVAEKYINFYADVLA